MKRDSTDPVSASVRAAMASRRQFLQSGVAAYAMLGGGFAAWVQEVGSRDPDLMEIAFARGLALERFVFDTRFVESTRAASAAAAHGIRLAPTSGDLTSLWYHDLDLRWKGAPMVLAGVTTRGNLFVLETLAADRSMKVEHIDAVVAGGPGSPTDALYSWIIVPRFVRHVKI